MQLLKRLCETPGVSGFEQEDDIEQTIELLKTFAEHAHEMEI